MTDRRFNEEERASCGRNLHVLLLFYAAASLLHFSHNAALLADYPNLPGWLSPARIYLAWGCISAVGVVGWLLTCRGREAAGLRMLAIYAALGFYGLLHYGRAPIASHSTTMNATILLEVLAAALLLIAVLSLAIRRRAGIR